MKLSHAMTLALSVAFIPAVGLRDAIAAEQRKVNCSQISEHMILAEGAAYDGPGGGKIGYLSPETKYLVVTTIIHTDEESWILLTGSGGAHIGWIMEKTVKRNYSPGLRCTIPIEGLYRRPQ